MFAIDGNQMVIALRALRPGKNSPLHLPSGMPRPDETPRKAAERELFERTGYRSPRVLELGERWIDPSNSDLRYSPFLACGCEKVTEPSSEMREGSKTVLIPVPEWFQKIWGGEINDSVVMGPSVLALPLITQFRF
jgi:8-oxo-dGTP pyrophosphatase MutT (NUDIX family)